MQFNIILRTSDKSQNENIQVMTVNKKFLIGAVIDCYIIYVTARW